MSGLLLPPSATGLPLRSAPSGASGCAAGALYDVAAALRSVGTGAQRCFRARVANTAAPTASAAKSAFIRST